jgi:hypothetical protein
LLQQLSDDWRDEDLPSRQIVLNDEIAVFPDSD